MASLDRRKSVRLSPRERRLSSRWAGDSLIPALTSQLDGALQGFLGFDCILIDVHLHLVFFGELRCSHLRRSKGRAVGVSI